MPFHISRLHLYFVLLPYSTRDTTTRPTQLQTFLLLAWSLQGRFGAVLVENPLKSQRREGRRRDISSRFSSTRSESTWAIPIPLGSTNWYIGCAIDLTKTEAAGRQKQALDMLFSMRLCPEPFFPFPDTGGLFTYLSLCYKYFLHLFQRL